MISMIWFSQTALRFADTDLFTTILFSLILMWIVMSFKGDDEGGVTGLFQYLIAAFLYFFTSSRFWNKNTLPQDERKAVKSKKENKKTKENPPPVLVDNPKKKQKKGKRSAKRNFGKENIEPTVSKKETKMFARWDICDKLNRDPKSIYDHLFKYTLTDIQLRMNHFPHEGFQPWTQVEADDSNRQCARCGGKFDISNGVYLSSSKCHYHPRKATFVAKSGVKMHGCCNGLFGSAPCAISNHHVTVQHRPRALTKTSSRRHVKKDLQHSIFSLDCEMCYTTDGLEVVRVGLVNLEGLAVYDGYVKPQNKILDYNTLYSGVEQSHLQNVAVTLDDVKKILGSFIQEDTILVGHALNNDLSALGLIHSTIVDTSVLYADPRIPSKKTALKTLASQYLGLQIQDGAAGHDCIDDARATLQLALLQVPASVPRPFPEQAHHQPVAPPQRTTPGPFWKHDQQPLMELQNVDCRFQPGVYDYCGSELARIYGPNSLMLYSTSNLRPYSPCLREGY